MANEQKIVATAGLVSVAVGSANSIVKYKRPPSSRFLIGSGVAFLVLSAMGQSESLGELAKGLALGIMTTILLGEGGGVLSYFAGAEMDTQAPHRVATKKGPQAPRPHPSSLPMIRTHMQNSRGGFKLDTVPAQPGIRPA